MAIAQPRALHAKRGAPTGWPIVAYAALAIALMIAALLTVGGTGNDGLRLVIRATARTSVVLFLLAFTATALRRRWPTPATRWLLANRRYVGVSFGVSHLAHLLAILALTGWSMRGFFVEAGLTAGILGGIGYLLIAAMVATSFDATAAWLGPRWWRRLHTTGLYYLSGVFLATFAPHAATAPLVYGSFTALLLAAIVLRLRS